jgi:hypothetical protein
MTAATTQRWLSVEEVAGQLGISYRLALALVQDNKVTWRLKNPDAKRRTYLVAADSVRKYERNTTNFARR